MAPNSRQRKGKSNRPNTKDERNGESSGQLRSYTYYLYIILILVAAGCISAGYRSYLSTLFENDRYFSHLSTLERELAFRTEMGLYFSYFKTMITSESAFQGLNSIMYDNITEYPSVINTLKRFNLYPEVILGCVYNLYQGVSDLVGHNTKSCWTVNRGDGLSPVQSCEGLGEPAYFYVEAVFLLNGLMMGLFFLFGTYLSGSIFGGLFTVICIIFNHGQCTRVMWTPPLRESFGYPLFLLQMFFVTYIIRNRQSSFRYSLLIAFAQIMFMLSWQFAQFALLTQTLSVLGTYILMFIPRATFRAILLGQTIGLLSSYILLFGNEMLLTSFFACCLFAAWGIVFFERFYRRLKYRFLVLLSQGVTLITLTLSSKFVFGKVLHREDDAHIGEIFLSKFTDFRNFHTMMYTCAREFDFIDSEALWTLLQTLLLPGAVFTGLALAIHILRTEWESTYTVIEDQAQPGGESPVISSKKQGKPDAELVYHSFQLLAFTAMAVLIMRLKLFWTPHMCLFMSLLANHKILPVCRKEIRLALLGALLACMAVKGIADIQKQLSIIGEFSNIAQEELVVWINENTPKNAVFAGSMPTMATVKLCTLRPIVNHPHYEDAGLRARTKLVYTIYSRKPLPEVKKNLQSLGAQYVILEDSWCTKRSRPGCSLPEMWDLEDVENQKNQPTCTVMKRNPYPHFKVVFANNVYQVLKLT